MSPIVRGTMAWRLAPGLVFRTFNRYRERPEEYRRLVKVQNSTRAYEDDYGGLSGFGPLAPKGELETTMLDEPYQEGNVRYVHQTLALGFAISKEMIDDDQYNTMNELAGQLGRSSRYTAELYGHDVFNNAFTTAKYIGRDGVALFSLTHPIRGTGGVKANRPAVDVDLSEAALEAGIQNFETQIDDRGMPIDIRPTRLVVSPENRMLAKRLLQSAGMPGGNNNDINPLYDEGIEVIVDHYLTDTDQWMLLGPPEDIDVRFYWREMPDTVTWNDNDADATFHKIRQRHSTGFGDWRGTYGSMGA